MHHRPVAMAGLLALALSLSSAGLQAEVAGYTCFPSCQPFTTSSGPTPNDGRFLSLAGDALATFDSDAITVVFGLPPTATTMDFGIFDGDTGAGSRWDSVAGAIDLDYSLYEDPLGNGLGSVLVGQWTQDDFVDNDWVDFSVPVGPGAQAPSGKYFYRLVIQASNAQPQAWTNFKVRTPDSNSLTLKPQAFNFTGAIFATGDIFDIYPAFPAATPTAYDGSWTFFARLDASTDTARFWDGDLDYGSADCVMNDTDDPDTPGAPFLPPWAATTSAFEGVAVGDSRACGTLTGFPADDIDFTYFVRSPAVSYTLQDPFGNVFSNPNPSGNLEWESFTLTTDPLVSADYLTTSLPAGIYPIHMTGMDMSNFNSWFIPVDVVGVCEETGEGSAPIFFDCSPDFSPFLVGDFVWNDLDGDGLQDPGEPGIPGVTVELVDPRGSVLQSTTTDASGLYQFEVEAASYTVRVVEGNLEPGGPLAGFASTTGGESQTNTVIDDNVITYDFGYHFAVVEGSIGDRLWFDADADGVQDAGEGGLDGVTVTLKNDAGVVVDSQVTTADGHYLFAHLAAGLYTVEVVSATLPGGLVQTFDLDGTATAHRATLTLGAGQDRTDVDFGYAKSTGGSIGDRVWIDLDRDGIQDAGEPGWNGRTVRLRSGGATGTILATKVTAGDGNYLFLNLAAGTYTVEVVVSGVSNLVRTFDLDGTSTANRATLTLAANQNRTDADFGYVIKLKPILECVIDNKDDTFTAYFGYQNDNPVALTKAIGSSNKFSPSPQDRGQPTTFQPGRTSPWPHATFSVTALDWQTLVWTLDGKTASATDKSTPCSYHVYFDKEWVDADGHVSTAPPAALAPDFEIYAESEIGKVSCYYPKETTKLFCEYWNQRPPAADNQGLWVPVGTEYWVTEKNLPPGWTSTAGAGVFPMPNGHCLADPQGAENVCLHTVTNSEAPARCADAAISDPQWALYSGHQALWLPGIATDLVFEDHGRLYEFANGTARLSGVVRSVADPKTAFLVDLLLSGKTTSPPAGSPHKELKPPAYVEQGGPIDPATWYYYGTWEGTLIGVDGMVGADVWLQGHLAFQIGFGANGKNLHLGGSAWLNYDVKSQPKDGKIEPKGNGDVNIDVNECPAVLLPVLK